MAAEDEKDRRIAELERQLADRDRVIEQLLRRIERLERSNEELRRAAKRQAAPFSRGEPKANPAKRGRKRGKRYGKRATRAVPTRIDQVVHVPAPLYCPTCEKPTELIGQQKQWQTDFRDGWIGYRGANAFPNAASQTCLAHILRRIGHSISHPGKPPYETPHSLFSFAAKATARGPTWGGATTTTGVDSLDRHVVSHVNTGSSPSEQRFAYDLAGNRVYSTAIATRGPVGPARTVRLDTAARL